MNSSLHPFEMHRIALDRNVLLHSEPSGASLEQVKGMKLIADLEQAEGSNTQLNLAKVSEEEIAQVHEHWGESGLLQLLILVMSTETGEFDHFYNLVRDQLRFGSTIDGGNKRTIQFDNASLASDDRLDAFAYNVLNPSLSRKLYRAGRHHGSLVYGLGGPRILVSHPFQGIDRDMYDVYANSVDVVTSLNMCGYHGTFHLLDYLAGLDYELAGFPAWALWFSVIAAHSDLVVFVKEFEGLFGTSQLLEIALTPDRVRKKIVEIPHDELSWAKKPDPTDDLETLYVTEKGLVSKDEWNQSEASHAAPFIKIYVEGGVPSDRLIVVREDRVDEYPLDFPVYDAGAHLKSTTTRFLKGHQGENGGAKLPSSTPSAWWRFWKRHGKR